ncbi:MAG: C4-dicarboxylate ABC transporter substrate-binding protein [Rhodospirillaceae bacterium]|nr:C4-dicarboxylate ABC transporter substrate-binding protein [Rhodospirillaceae bacterium]
MNKNTLIVVLLLAVAGLGGWMYLQQDKGGQMDAAAGKQFIAIGTGGPTGVYFATGNAICRLVAKEAAEGRKKGRKHGIRCSAPSTGGSTYNIGQIAAGELDFGVAQSDWQYHAVNCSSKKVTCFKKLRAVFSVHPEPFHIITGKDAGISGWGDLKGKRINIGNPGSGQRGTMEVLMAAHGTKTSDFAQATELTSTEQSKALCDGKIDAYGYTVGVPNAGVAVATDGCGAKIINLASDVEKGLVKKNPYYAFATIPQGTYKTTDADVTTFGVMATFVTSADTPAATVYELVRAVMENIEDFRKLHPAFKHLDPKKMIKNGLSAPLHDGAAKYYKEKGWIK